MEFSYTHREFETPEYQRLLDEYFQAREELQACQRALIRYSGKAVAAGWQTGLSQGRSDPDNPRVCARATHNGSSLTTPFGDSTGHTV